MIYRLLLMTEYEDTILDDPKQGQVGYLYPARENIAGNDPALLRTCQQIHDEMTPLLYDTKMFFFDSQLRFAAKIDDPLSERLRQLNEVDVLSYIRPDPLPPCQTFILELCFTTQVINWLEDIGQSNIHNIRRLRLCFADANFTLGRRSPEDGRRQFMPFDYTETENDLSFGKAMETFSKHHRLETLEIVGYIGDTSDDYEIEDVTDTIEDHIDMLGHLFLKQKIRSRKLRMITGLEKFTLTIKEKIQVDGQAKWAVYKDSEAFAWLMCRYEKEHDLALKALSWERSKKRLKLVFGRRMSIMKKALEGFQEAKALMESGHETCQLMQPGARFSLPFIDQVDMA